MTANLSPQPAGGIAAWRAYLSLARPDHWFKNIFLLPGILVAVFFYPDLAARSHWPGWLAGFLVACVIASANYVLNEIMDADYDRFHPKKCERPLASGRARRGPAWVLWALLSLAGLAAGFALRPAFGVAVAALWGMGVLYNTPPIRLKDLPYADVLSESINNPIRLAMGWYCAAAPAAPPLSLFIAYWMFGAFLMAAKRFAEYRSIGDPERSASYRRSFAYYSEERLLVSIFYYAALFGMMSGVFISRYKFELALAAPVVAYCLAYYIHLAYKPNSPVQYPERLFRQRKLMLLVASAFAVCTLLLFLRLPGFTGMFQPLIRPARAAESLSLPEGGSNRTNLPLASDEVAQGDM